MPKRLKCVFCGSIFFDIKHKGRKFCSQKCSGFAQRGKIPKGRILFKKGHKNSLESRKKMSLARMGKPPWNKGVKTFPATPETKRKMSIAHKGKKMKPLTQEHKRKLSEAHKGKIFTEAHRRAISESHKQKVAKGDWHSWKGGITPINSKIRASLEYRLWRESVFKRDNYTCIWCGLCSGNGKAVILNADHIKPFALYPELRFAIDNGRTLCVPCHKKTDTYMGRIKQYVKPR